MSDEKLDTQIRREQITEAALAIVAAQGVRHLSVAAVAKKVGLVPSGIYRHFQSKDEILAAVLDLLEARITQLVAVARQSASDPLGQLHTLFHRHLQFISQGRALPRMVFSDDVDAGSPTRKARVRKIFDTYRGFVRGMVEHGQREGIIRDELSTDSVAMMFLGMIVPAGVLWHLSDGEFDLEAHARGCWQVFHDAVATLSDAHPASPRGMGSDDASNGESVSDQSSGSGQ